MQTKPKETVIHIDLESTGLTSGSEIIQAAYIVQVYGIPISADNLFYRLDDRRAAQRVANGEGIMPYGAYEVHGLQPEMLAARSKRTFSQSINEFTAILSQCDAICAHNANFDVKTVLYGYEDPYLNSVLNKLKVYDTQTQFPQIYNTEVYFGKSGIRTYKEPSLSEVFSTLINHGFTPQELYEEYCRIFKLEHVTRKTFHDASFDVFVCYKGWCYGMGLCKPKGCSRC